MQSFTWPLIIITLLFAFTLILFLSNLSINIKFLRENNNNTLDITVRILFISFRKILDPEALSQKKEVDLPDKSKEEQTEGRPNKPIREKLKTVSIKDILEQYRELLGFFLRYSSWQRFNCRLVLGFRNSFTTGLGSGIAWVAGGNLISFLNRNLRFKESRPAFNVIPDFKGGGLVVDIDAAFSVRVVILTVMLIKAVKTYLKAAKT